MRVRYPKWLKWGVSGAVFTLLALNLIAPPPIDKAEIVSAVVTDKDGQWLSGFTVEDGRWRLPADMDTLDPRFVRALIAIEDKRFYSHGGVDPLATARAIKSLAQRGEVVSGASTLTMQLARQIEPRERTFGSKLIEVARAAQYEVRLSKPEILQHYLTHAPYGGNLEGVRAASLSYFGEEPTRLTDAQIALLIALPQAPEARRPDLRPKAAKAARDLILTRLGEKGVLTPAQVKEGKQAPIETRRRPLPENGWLTAQRLKSSAGTRAVKTTLDGQLQNRLEVLAGGFAQGQSDDLNAALLVIDNKTREVRASVGSAGRERPGGWIDMATVTRSPGSALKPFIYGLAFDDGIAAPGSRILDAPTRFGTYQPENFTKRYHGNVTISQALQHSLNVPAVAALEHIGEDRFEAALRATGIELDVPKGAGGKTGLAIALGGAGVSAEGLGVLYSSLANDGMAAPLIWRDGDAQAQSFALMTPQSAQQITQILRQAPTPPGRVPPWLTRGANPIAYKTGTSYGFRDAWAAGYTDEWTVIVWTGRADGAPLPGQTGRTMAAPLMYDVFAQLGRSDTQISYVKPDRAPAGLQDIKADNSQIPVILFPADNTDIAVAGFGQAGRGISLSARAPGREKLDWYVDGRPIEYSARSGNVVWHPPTEGFYRLSVVDAAGQKAVSRVRIVEMN